MAKEKTRVKKRERKNITTGVAHVSATFNNNDDHHHRCTGQYDCLVNSWYHGGSRDRANRPPYAAQMAAEDAGKKAQEHGMRNLEVEVKGPGSGRESALRALQAAGFQITSIRDVTPIPHNGCRPRKRRRV